MICIGLTGGIGSGKSTVASLFKDLGISVYDSDKKAKKLMRTSKKVRKNIIALLGQEAYIDTKLNRAYIAEKVFNDKALLSSLNAIVHPAVRKNFIKWCKKQDGAYVIQETALLFENNAAHLYDYTIVVTAPKDIRIKRLLERDGSTEKQIKSRMNNQLDDDAKTKLADFVIENIHLKDTQEKVQKVHQSILNS